MKREHQKSEKGKGNNKKIILRKGKGRGNCREGKVNGIEGKRRKWKLQRLYNFLKFRGGGHASINNGGVLPCSALSSPPLFTSLPASLHSFLVSFLLSFLAPIPSLAHSHPSLLIPLLHSFPLPFSSLASLCSITHSHPSILLPFLYSFCFLSLPHTHPSFLFFLFLTPINFHLPSYFPSLYSLPSFTRSHSAF